MEKVEAPGFIKMNTWIGRRMEVHSTAVGKALLAYLDPKERDRILRQRGLKKLTRTPSRRSAAVQELERVRQLGYRLTTRKQPGGALRGGADFNAEGRY